MKPFTTRSPISAEMIADQVVMAFEGGITYWASAARPTDKSETPLKPMPDDPWYANPSLYDCNFEIRIVQHEEHVTGAGTDLFLTRDSVQRGLDILSEKHPTVIADMLLQEGDADTADTFIQVCVFGEVVYG